MLPAADIILGGQGCTQAGKEGEGFFSPDCWALWRCLAGGLESHTCGSGTPHRAVLTFAAVAPLSPILVLSHMVPAIPANPCWILNSKWGVSMKPRSLSPKVIFLICKQTKLRAVFVLVWGVGNDSVLPLLIRHWAQARSLNSRFALC